MQYPTTVTALTFEHHRHALGIGEPAPRLSWRTLTDEPDWTQRAYRVRIAGADGAILADTGRTPGAESVLVPWPGPPLVSRDRATVRVRVWGGADDTPSPWSEPADVETGLLDPADWSASFVTPDTGDDEGALLGGPAPPGLPHRRRHRLSPPLHHRPGRLRDRDQRSPRR